MFKASISVVRIGSAAGLDDEGLTGCEGQVLVKKLKAVGQGQEHADGDGGHHIGDGHLEQGLHAGGAVDAGGLDQLLGQGGLHVAVHEVKHSGRGDGGIIRGSRESSIPMLVIRRRKPRAVT